MGNLSDINLIATQWFSRLPEERARSLFFIVHPTSLYSEDSGKIRAVYEFVRDGATSTEASTKLEQEGYKPVPKKDWSSTKYYGKLTDGSIVEGVHFAQDLSGEEQPPFSGWYYPVKDSTGNCLYMNDITNSLAAIKPME